MKFESRFNIGDKVWVADGYKPRQVTVGQIRIKHTDSPGREGEEMFNNYKPQKNHTERYMCVETGIGSGSVWELGFNLFGTKLSCKIACKERQNK